MSEQSFVPPGSHPVLRCAEVLESALKDVADVDPGFMPIADKKAAVIRLAQAETMLKELQLRVRASAGDVAEDEGARDLAEWTAHHARQDRGLARREQRLAEGLQERWHLVAAGMGQGAVNPEQAHAITRALDGLPEGLDPDVVIAAEQRLVAEAEHFGPGELKVMGRRILDVIAPSSPRNRNARRWRPRNARPPRRPS